MIFSIGCDQRNEPRARFGESSTKSSEDPKIPCCIITGFFLFDVDFFELHRNILKIYPSSVVTL